MKVGHLAAFVAMDTKRSQFMQRAAASNKSSPDHTPEKPGASRRSSHKGSPHAGSPSDLQKIQQAIADEERKRQEAVDREAARRGETKWYLNVKPTAPLQAPLIVVSAGYASLDSTASRMDATNGADSDDEAETPVSGRMRFGNFNSNVQVSYTFWCLVCGSD